MNRMTLLAGAILATGLGGWLLYDASTVTAPALADELQPAGDALAVVTLPETLSDTAMIGKRAFDAVCADCHGVNATGRDGVGPPLVHKIYEPSHHGDASFYMAAQNGVRAHHWRFGDMPAQTGLTRADIGNIISYVRELQRANGIGGQ